MMTLYKYRSHKSSDQPFSKKSGAGGESRTLVTSLENLDINRYTTPAWEYCSINFQVFKIKKTKASIHREKRYQKRGAKGQSVSVPEKI